MKKILVIFVLQFLLTCITFAQHSSEIQALELHASDWSEKYLVPEDYFGFSFQENQLISDLQDLSNDQDYFTTIELPLPNGKMDYFSVQAYEIMEKGLAKNHPDIKAFKGYNQWNPENKIYLTISDQKGLDVIYETDAGISLIHKISDRENYYASYLLKDCPIGQEGISAFQCDVEHDHNDANDLVAALDKKDRTKSAENYDLLRYRIAVACTGEFASKYGGTINSVTSEIVSILNKVNLALHRDVGIELQLINDNEDVLFFTASSDPYTNGNTGAMIGENGPVLRNRLGSSSYDIGHVFGTNGGGLAALGSVCQGNKENGVSCQFGNYSSTNFFIIVAHELGHQFSATHTFNNCQGNETSGTAYEPGSGNTIMSYSGAGCGSPTNNWNQSVNDPYYHVNSIQRIRNFTRDQGPGSECAQNIETDNECPEVSIPYESGFYIPVKTPFELQGEATDINGDDLTYTWEEYDLGPVVPVRELPRGTAPHFKFNPPTDVPYRSFPSLQNILSNNFLDRLDYLPDSTRPMTFRFTARDNNEEAGAVSWDEFNFFITAEAGPFRVLQPSNGESLLAGVYNFINWDPAQSQLAPVNCSNVDIMISTDGGLTFNDTLVADAPNDGRALVLIPQSLLGEENVRIKIKCSESIFFDLSDRNSNVIEPSEPSYVGIIEPEYQEICLPEKANIQIETKSILDYDSTVFVKYDLNFTDGVQIDLASDRLVPGESLNFTVEMDEDIAGDTLEVYVQLFNNKDTFEYVSRILAISNNFSDQELLLPEDGISGGSLIPSFEWTKSADARSYQFQLATNASFDNSFIIYEEQLSGTRIEKPITLDGSTIYYWRVNTINKCGIFETGNINVFSTEVLSCKEYSYSGGPVRISSNGTPEVEMTLTVVESGPVNDLNVLDISASHSFVGNLSAKLISPAGTEVKLWSNKCANRTTIAASFDDEATEEFDCLFLSTPGPAIEPEEPLANFNGEEQFGNWTLVVNDNAGGDGGELESFKVEVCAAAYPDAPDRLVNEQLSMNPATIETINSNLLAYGHPNVEDRNVIFAMTRPTAKGQIKSGARVIGVGQGFRMSDILAGNITYEHQSGATDEWDSFEFIVYNTEGPIAGPVDIFNIKIGNPVGVQERENQLINIYPNPNGMRMAYLDLPYESNWEMQMLSMDGRKVPVNYSLLGQKAKLSWGDIHSGVYLIKLFNAKDQFTTRLFIK